MLMKISKEKYQEMVFALNAAIERIGVDRVRHHRRSNDGKNKEVRFMWDLYYAANAHHIFRGDRNINDSHIETALKKYINGRGDL